MLFFSVPHTCQHRTHSSIRFVCKQSEMENSLEWHSRSQCFHTFSKLNSDFDSWTWAMYVHSMVLRVELLNFAHLTGCKLQISDRLSTWLEFIPHFSKEFSEFQGFFWLSIFVIRKLCFYPLNKLLWKINLRFRLQNELFTVYDAVGFGDFIIISNRINWIHSGIATKRHTHKFLL